MATSKTITEFASANLTALRNDINAALAKVGAKYGISIQAGSASYRATNANFKLVCMVGEGKTIADSRQEKMKADLGRYMKVYAPDLKLNAKYVMNGVEYKIVGYNSRGRTQPVIIRNKEGKQYKASIEALRSCRTVSSTGAMYK